MADHWIYHITHIQNLPGILAEDALLPDAEIRRQNVNVENIGYNHIKNRRMRRPIRAGMEGTLGQYVPFNFCSKSVMLFVVNQGHSDYHGGQDEILHLVSSVNTVVQSGQSWVFTDIHADLDYANHYDDLDRLEKAIDWSVMDLQYWSDPEVKKRRQAEFLVWQQCAWKCIRAIATRTEATAERVRQMLAGAQHQPTVVVRPGWYYSTKTENDSTKT